MAARNDLPGFACPIEGRPALEADLRQPGRRAILATALSSVAAAALAACGGGGGGSSGGAIVGPIMLDANPATAAPPAPAATPTSVGAEPQPAAPAPQAATPASSSIAQADPAPIEDVAPAQAEKARLLKLQQSAAAAPVDRSGIAALSGVTVNQFGQGVVPTLTGEKAFVRRYISGAGIGLADLDSIVKFFNRGQMTHVDGGKVTCNGNDDSHAEFWDAGDRSSSPLMMGFHYDGRSFSLSGTTFSHWSLWVEGVGNLRPDIVFSSNGSHTVVDFGSAAPRKILLTSALGTWLSEIGTGKDRTVTPWDWRAEQRQPVAGFLNDSYGYGFMYGLVGMSFLEYQSKLMGYGAWAASVIGSTGYLKTNPGQADNAQEPFRQRVIDQGGVDCVHLQLGINDPLVGFGPASAKVIDNQRAALGNAGLLVVMGPWAPSQSAATRAGSSYLARRDLLLLKMRRTSGPWIFLDNLAGTWETSRGKTRPAARGPWQTGDGFVAHETGVGNSDTWVSSDGTHPTALGDVNLAEIYAAEYKQALATF